MVVRFTHDGKTLGHSSIEPDIPIKNAVVPVGHSNKLLNQTACRKLSRTPASPFSVNPLNPGCIYLLSGLYLLAYSGPKLPFADSRNPGSGTMFSTPLSGPFA